jgi:MFS family permease
VFFLFADQNLMAPNLSSIADEFGFSDHERDEKLGGYIAFGFFIVGGPVALLVGYFTDSVNRCILFAIVVTLGEAACLATYWIKTYEQLLFCRILTGISIGGSTPIIFSILGDLFPGNYRVYVSTLVGISMSSGIAGGQLLAGVVGPVYGWRLPFLLVSIPAILCANLVMMTVKEPGRGSQEKEVRLLRQRKFEERKKSLEAPKTDIESFNENEIIKPNIASVIYQQDAPLNSLNPLHSDRSSSSLGAEEVDEVVDEVVDEEAEQEDEEVEYSEKIEWRKLKVLFSTPSVWIIFLQGLPGCLPWGMVYVFLNDYFSADRGLSVAAATFALTCFGVGGLVGQLWGGWYGQRLYNRDPCYQCLLMGGSTLVAVAPMLYLINTRAAGDAIFYCMAVLAGATISINGPNVRTVLQVSLPFATSILPAQLNLCSHRRMCASRKCAAQPSPCSCSQTTSARDWGQVRGNLVLLSCLIWYLQLWWFSLFKHLTGTDSKLLSKKEILLSDLHYCPLLTEWPSPWWCFSGCCAGQCYSVWFSSCMPMS